MAGGREITARHPSSIYSLPVYPHLTVAEKKKALMSSLHYQHTHKDLRVDVLMSEDSKLELNHGNWGIKKEDKHRGRQDQKWIFYDKRKR